MDWLLVRAEGDNTPVAEATSLRVLYMKFRQYYSVFVSQKVVHDLVSPVESVLVGNIG